MTSQITDQTPKPADEILIGRIISGQKLLKRPSVDDGSGIYQVIPLNYISLSLENSKKVVFERRFLIKRAIEIIDERHADEHIDDILEQKDMICASIIRRIEERTEGKFAKNYALFLFKAHNGSPLTTEEFRKFRIPYLNQDNPKDPAGHELYACILNPADSWRKEYPTLLRK